MCLIVYKIPRNHNPQFAFLCILYTSPCRLWFIPQLAKMRMKGHASLAHGRLVSRQMPITICLTQYFPACLHGAHKGLMSADSNAKPNLAWSKLNPSAHTKTGVENSKNGCFLPGRCTCKSNLKVHETLTDHDHRLSWECRPKQSADSLNGDNVQASQVLYLVF